MIRSQIEANAHNYRPEGRLPNRAPVKGLAAPGCLSSLLRCPVSLGSIVQYFPFHICLSIFCSAGYLQSNSPLGDSLSQLALGFLLLGLPRIQGNWGVVERCKKLLVLSALFRRLRYGKLSPSQVKKHVHRRLLKKKCLV